MSFTFPFRHHIQRILHDPENNQYGDCSRTCIAMMLGIEPEDVPHFGDPNLFPDANWAETERQWIAEHGYGRVMMAFPGSYSVSEMVSTITANGRSTPTLLMGKSPRGKWNHDVVVFDGRIYDPHPDQSGLAGPCIRTEDREDRWYWISVMSSIATK